MSIFFIVILFIFGLFIGSFLNVLIDRIPRNEKITGRSYCEFCKQELKWYDLLPVLSFVSLGGKCRYCKAKLSLYYPLVEFVTGTLFAATYLFVSNASLQSNYYLLTNIYYLTIVSIMIVIFFADLKYGVIPDKVLFPAIIVSFVFLLFDPMYHKLVYDTVADYLLVNHVFSAIGAFGLMLFLFLATKGKGMGFGDVKLSFLIGLILGFPAVFYSIYLAFLTGGLTAIILVLWKKRKLKSEVPFGPFLVGSFLLVFYFYPQIDRLALSLIN